MNLFLCILYGFIMGLSEFIPVSSGAQSQILQHILGAPYNDPVRDLVIHIFSLVAFFLVWRNPLESFVRDSNLRLFRNQGYQRGNRSTIDSRYIRSAILPMLITMIFGFYYSSDLSLPTISFILLIGGIILYLPERLLQGNKSARSMSSLDALLLGVSSGLGAISGLSRIGLGISLSMIRGADRKHALNWAYILSVSALVFTVFADLVRMCVSPITFTAGFSGYLFFAISSFAGSYLSVFLFRNVIIHRGLHAFSYYAWGMSLMAFILYLL